MIRPLRARHRRLVAGTAVAVGIIGAAALAVRHPVPTVRTEVLDEAESSTSLRFDRVDADGLLQRYDDGRISLALELGENAPEPSLAVYWVAGANPIETGLPAVNTWLGRVTRSSGRSFAIPGSTAQRTGSIVLYSLSRQRVLDQAMVRVPPTASRDPA